MIIMLCRNNVELSKRCLETLIGQDNNILVIDNASEDSTHYWVRIEANAGRIWRMQVPSQKSVAYCWNRGIKWGMEHFKSDCALVVNNDTELRPDTYATLRHHLSVSGAGMMTCVSVRERERMQGNFELSVDGYRPHPDFSCFMLSKTCYGQVGPFDERYEGAYAEDADYHVRMHRAGIQALNCGLPFLHHGSGTLKGAGVAEGLKICEAADRNRQRFFEKYGVRIGSDEYSSLFTAESFGSAAAAAHSVPNSPHRAPQSE